MVERKHIGKRLSHGKVRQGPELTKTICFQTSVGSIHREVRHGNTNSDGFKHWRSTMVERSTKKTPFEVERSTPEAFFLVGEWKAQIAEFKEYNDGIVSRCNEKNAGWLAPAQDRKRWKRKKHSFPRGLGKSTLKHGAQKHKKERICS